MIYYLQSVFILIILPSVRTHEIFLLGESGLQIFDTDKNAGANLTLKDFPVINQTVAVSYQGHVYVIGGRTANSQFEWAVYIIDIDQQSFMMAPSMKNGRSDHAATVTSHGIIVCGGITSSSPIPGKTTCEIFDGHYWDYAGLLPNDISGLRMATLNDTAYTFGGKIYGSSQKEYISIPYVFAYDQTTYKWTKVADLPRPMTNHGAVALNKTKALICGELDTAFGGENDCFIFDATTNTFEKGPSSKSSRSEFGFVNADDGTVYALGGTHCQPCQNATALDSVEVLKANASQWKISGGKLAKADQVITAALIF